MDTTDHPILPPAPLKLPVLATVLGSCVDLWEHWRAAARLMASWGVVLGAVGTLAFAMLIGAQNALSGNPWLNLLVLYAPVAVYGLFIVSTAVGWHRLLLLGEEPGRIYLRLDGQVWRYVGLIALMVGVIFIVSFVVTLPIGFGVAFFGVAGAVQGSTTLSFALAAFGGIAIFVIAQLILSRLYVVLPARAVGQQVKFRQALRATKGNSWRLMLGTLLAAVPLYVINAAIDLLLDFQVRTQGGGLNWIGIVGFLSLTAVALAALIALTLVTVGYISRAYRFFAAQLATA
jgi:hypothetical protein